MTNVVVEEKSTKQKKATLVLSILISIVFLFCGIGILTDVGEISNPNIPMAEYEPDESTNDDSPAPYIPFFEEGIPQNPLMTVTPAPAIQRNETFDINFSGEVPDIFNALPSQTFDTTVSITNESNSVDSAYLKVTVNISTIEIDGKQEMIFKYHKTNDWEISYTPQSDYSRVEAIYRYQVRAGEEVTLFDSVTINPKLDREHYLNLYHHRLVSNGDTPSFNIQFDATGVQITGFDGYRAAFA